MKSILFALPLLLVATLASAQGNKQAQCEAKTWSADYGSQESAVKFKVALGDVSIKKAPHAILTHPLGPITKKRYADAEPLMLKEF